MFTVNEKVQFIESVFGKGTLAKNLSNIEVVCPICLSQKPTNKRKLAIRLADDVTHCWVCGWSSRSMWPLIKRFGTADELQTYREKFATSRILSTSPDDVISELRLPKDFVMLATVMSSRDPDIKAALAYLMKDRGLNERDFWYFKFGYSTELPRRVIMPSFDARGRLNFYTARGIDRKCWPKYIDPPKEMVEKTSIIFNEINIDWTKELNIVEGPYDLTKCPSNTTCLQGNQLTEDTLLFNEIAFHDTPCVVMLDDDAKMRASSIARKLAAYNVKVRVADLGQHHDPGEMTCDQVREHIELAKPWEWDGHIREKFATVRFGLRM